MGFWLRFLVCHITFRNPFNGTDVLLLTTGHQPLCFLNIHGKRLVDGQVGIFIVVVVELAENLELRLGQSGPV